MGSYVIKRIAMALVVAILVTSLLAVLAEVIPGDPARIILGPRATPELVADVRAEMGLDEPLPTQVWTFVTDAVQGDLGQDFVRHQGVASMIGEALPYTLILAVVSLGLALLIGLPLGVMSANKRGGFADRAVTFVAVPLIAVPAYVAGLLLLWIFAVELGWLPAIGGGELGDPAGYLEHLILPAVALALSWIGYLARLVQTSMVEALGSDYVRTATAVGLRRSLVVYKYALRNAIVPTVAVLGVGLGSLAAGAIFVEVIFARPGLGSLMLDAIGSRNYPVVRGVALVIALIFVFANLLADLSIRALDPRLRRMA